MIERSQVTTCHLPADMMKVTNCDISANEAGYTISLGCNLSLSFRACDFHFYDVASMRDLMHNRDLFEKW